MSDQTDNQTATLELDGETARKLFVGGLSWQTTEDGLQRYLGTLGLEVERVLIMRDKLTGRSRGFGFVIMTKIEMLDKAVSLALQLDGRKIEAKRAIPKRDMGEKTSKKVFVGGIPISLSAIDFKKFFEQFGVVSDCQVMTERESGRSRGFGFVTFQDEATLETVLATQHNIQGKPVEVKRAEPKKVEKQPRPIILPVPYFPSSGYPYSAVAYAQSAASAGGLYGQPLTYDPSTGYLVASPMYTPQLLPVDDSTGRAVYEQYYFDPATSSISPLPPNVVPSPNAPLAAPNSANEPNAPKSNRGREVVGGPKGDYENSTSTLSLIDRVRANEVRKKRGMSDPEPERPKKANSPTTISSASAGRKVVTTTTGNWRTRVTTSPPSSATTSPTTVVKEGGTLHKYFQ